jgi:hypothetical protein
MWYLDQNGNDQWSGCGTDSCIHFGMSGDLPVAGDWNNSGPAKVGVFRPSTGMWYLESNGNGRWDGCETDSCFHFGVTGDLPIAGDWNGDGKSKVGVFRPSTGMWYLDSNGNGQWDGCGTDSCIRFGMSGDQPVAGDWNGSSTAKVGVFRPSTGWWYVDLNGNGAWDGCSVDGCYYFGTTGDVAIAGSWTNESGILTNEELGYLTPAERSEISLLNGSALIDKGLQNLTNQEVLKAKDYFKVAVGKYDGDSTNTAQKAWFFRALTRVSALAFDTAADGVEDGLQDIGDILDRAGYSSDPAKRNPFNYQALTLPTTVATNSPRGIEIQQFAYTMILPELMGAIDDLDHVLESFNVRWVEPLDGTSVESDYGDVLAFRTALKAAIASIYIQYAYNLDADTAIEYNDYMSSWFTAEAFLASNLNFGNLAAVNHLPSSREYLDGAATDALSAINWIQAETDDQSDDYVNLTNATPEEIIDTKNKIIAFQKSLYGSATINNEGTPDDTIINLTPAFTGLNLRSFLPQFVDNVPLGDLPDETFGRVLEKISGRPPTRLNEDWDGNATADILDLIPRKFHARDSWPLGVYVTWDKIKWGMLEVAIEYNVYWSTSPGVTQSSNRISTTKNWLLHSNLTPGAYYYRIAAVTAAGEGPLSEEAGVYVGQ